MAETNGTGHYIAHVRLERVTRETVSVPGTRGGTPTAKQERSVEELTNIVQKSANFDDLVAIVTQILEISKRASNLQQ